MSGRNVGALKVLALVGAAVAYAGAVVYGDIMFLQTVSVAFPTSGIFGSLAVAGALVTALSALVLPIALHWWFSPGLQFVWGVIFWVLDIVALSLNSMLAFQAASGGVMDSFIITWRSWSPATPMLAVVGWGICFLLDPSHKARHALAELEADQIDVYSDRLRAAAKSTVVSDVIVEAAREAALQYAQRLGAAHVVAEKPADHKSIADAVSAFMESARAGRNGHRKDDPVVLNAEGVEVAPVASKRRRR